MNVVNTFYGFDHEISLPHLFVLAEQVPLPKNIAEALHPDNPHREHWRGALKQEVSCFVKNNVIGACVKIAEVKAKGHKIVSTKSVFKVKPTRDGSVGRFRLRIVAKGCQTIPGLHYDQVYAPTARGSTVRLVLSIAATLALRLTNLDVETAFLTADLPRDKPIFIYRPDGFEDLVADDECCLLNKSLYGLCNSPRLFNREFTQHLISLGFRKCILDACLFVRDKVDGADFTVVALIVDDLIVAHRGSIDPLLAGLRKKYNMTVLGDLRHVLGMEVERDIPRKRVFISQCRYIDSMCRRYHMNEEDMRPVYTPADTCKLSKTMSPPSKVKDSKEDAHLFYPDGSMKPGVTIPYRSLVGALLYCAICTRPDIAYAVGQCARYVNAPGHAHWIAAKRILRYLRTTRDLKLPLGGSSLAMHAWCDSDWAGDNVAPEDSQKSTSSNMLFIGSGLVSWKSKLQETIAKSSVEAEYVSASSQADEVLWLRQLMKEIGFPSNGLDDGPTPIFTDSRGAKLAAKNPVNYKRLKHVYIKFHSIREHVERNEIRMLFVPGNDNIADTGTKPLPAPAFRKIRAVLFNRVPFSFPQKSHPEERRIVEKLARALRC
jgi:hypothetical protein